jgi:hypothetical protein
LWVRFVDGLEGEVDMAPMIKDKSVIGTVFEPLRNLVFFNTVFLDFGAVTWPNQADLAPDAMHDEIKAHGKWVLK